MGRTAAHGDGQPRTSVRRRGRGVLVARKSQSTGRTALIQSNPECTAVSQRTVTELRSVRCDGPSLHSVYFAFAPTVSSASRCTAAHTAAPLACRWRRRLPRPHVFFGSSGMFGLAAALWASTLLRFKKDVHKIHLLMGALLLVKLIATCVRLRLRRPRRCVEQNRNIVAPQTCRRNDWHASDDVMLWEGCCCVPSHPRVHDTTHIL